MTFDITERFETTVPIDQLITAVGEQFSRIAEDVAGNGNFIYAESINATFGSINRKDLTTIEVRQTDTGVLIIAAVNYSPSAWFWIFFICGLFTSVGWILPLIFYFHQKKTVKTSIIEVLTRLKHEYMGAAKSPASITPPKKTDYEELEKLSELLSRGILTQEEFEIKKKNLLGM
ncbi:MAG: SHOCT domain-containing protein [Treponemataceae bacterium]